MLVNFLENAKRLLGLPGRESGAERAYRALAEASRNPNLYRAFGVPDTFDGRFDALALHLSIFLAVLHTAGGDTPAMRAFAREVTEAFLADMDRALREAGRGDLAIGKEVKKMAAAFFGRLTAYGEALAKGDDVSLCEAIGRNLFRGKAPYGATLGNLAKYARLSYTELARRPAAELMAGRLAPNPFPVRP
ncbi:MAG TPA: ubiquinol-cytochrome C chaperone family protein [Sphingomonadales bacterium]|nr:ubiquinol-cytochrome C chaperone family protein [Sphingomonadales bacterium]